MNEKGKISRVSYVLAVFAGLILAVLLEGCIAGYRVSRGYGKDSAVFPLIPATAGGYVVGGEDGNLWVKTENDAWVAFYPEREVGHIRIYFQEPLLEEMNICCFYGNHGQYDSLQRKLHYLLEGTKEAVMTVPYGHWENLRLDIGGDFLLDRFEAAEAVPLKEITVQQVAELADKGRLLFFLLLFPVSGILMVQKREQKKQLSRERKPAKERIVFFDALRVLASLMVIFTHVIAPMEGIYRLLEKPLEYVLFLAVRFISMSCNQLFFMLSGALLLPWRDEKLSVFLQKRLMKVVLPLLVYGWIYIVFFCSSKASAQDITVAYSLSMLRGNVLAAPHLWMVFELIGIYLLVIPFRELLMNASEQTEKRLTGFILALMGMMSIGQYVNLELAVSTFLSGWTGVFLMGYLMRKDWMRKYDCFWMWGGAAALLLSVVLSLLQGSYSNFIFGTSILMQFIACGIFAGILHLETVLKKAGPFLAFCSKYSYSVLLIHWFILYSVVFIRELSSKQPMAIVVFAAFFVCTVLSLGFSVFMDNTLMAVLEWGLGKIRKK